MNAKLTEMQAAIASRVLDRIDQIRDHRRARAAEYRAQLAPLGFAFQREGECSAYQFMAVKTPQGLDVPRLRKALLARGVETRSYFAAALHQQPHFAQARRLTPLPVTEALCPRMLALPMSNSLSAEGVSQVCEALELALEDTR